MKYIPSTKDEFLRLERILVSEGLFKRWPIPLETRDPETYKCVVMFRAVLDLMFLELMRGPETPYPNSPQSKKFYEQNYRTWVHYLYGNNSDFKELCGLAFLDPSLVKDTVTKFIRKRREVIREHSS